MAIEIVDFPIKNGGSFHSFLLTFTHGLCRHRPHRCCRPNIGNPPLGSASKAPGTVDSDGCHTIATSIVTLLDVLAILIHFGSFFSWLCSILILIGGSYTRPCLCAPYALSTFIPAPCGVHISRIKDYRNMCDECGVVIPLPLATVQNHQPLQVVGICIWLAVSTPLKNISQLGWLFPIYGKIKFIFQTTNQVCICHDLSFQQSAMHRQLQGWISEIHLPTSAQLAYA